MNRELHYNDVNSRCYLHPKQVLIGICSSCLREKLVTLSLEQASSARDKSTYYNTNRSGRRKYSVSSINRVFIAFGSFFFNRRDNRNWKIEDSDQDCASTSQDGSFISIKFEENGVTTWENGKSATSKKSIEHCKTTTWNHSLRKNANISAIDDHANKKTKSVIQHQQVTHVSFRWRKKIGHLFESSRWKNSGKAYPCHDGKSLVADEIKVDKRRVNVTQTKMDIDVLYRAGA